MCGIYFNIIDYNTYLYNKNYYITKLNNSLDALSKRGPDSHNTLEFRVGQKFIQLAHTRLHINGNDNPQPITDNTGKLILIINGEIFNWHELEKELNYTTTQSDCEIILPLYKKYKYNLDEFFNKINGQFSMVLIDLELNKLLVSRDHIGITSMYYSFNHYELTIASNIACFKNQAVYHFEPRMYIYGDLCDITLKVNYYTDYTKNRSIYNNVDSIKSNINKLLTDSVQLRLTGLDDNYGFLLSGGLDSSLICSIATKLKGKIKTFSIGLEGSIDLKYAKEVAEYLGTEHYEYIITKEDIEDNIDTVIKITETYDITTIRASTAMYLLIKQIKQNFPKIKVLFSGELSDELFCYLYGSNAPNVKEFQKETESLVCNVYKYDCLRADKTSMANGIEIRVPFTDPKFINYVLNTSPKFKVFGNLDPNYSIEKFILRESFKGYLPDSVLYRKKEQFSDGVSAIDNSENNMITILKNYCKRKLENECSEMKLDEYEKKYYKQTFDSIFNGIVFNMNYWRPKWSENIDPSGRVQSFWST